MAEQICLLFETIPVELDDFILASQITQAEALKFLVEKWRSGKWRRTGILWWNLRDGWPIISDAVVDYYNRKKLAYAYLKRVQTDVCAICCESVGGRHPVVIVNDTREPEGGHVTLCNVDDDSVLLDENFEVAANSKVTVGQIALPEKPAMWVTRWTYRSSETSENHYLAGPRPFCLEDLRRWLRKMGLLPVGE